MKANAHFFVQYIEIVIQSCTVVLHSINGLFSMENCLFSIQHYLDKCVCTVLGVCEFNILRCFVLQRGTFFNFIDMRASGCVLQRTYKYMMLKCLGTFSSIPNFIDL